MQIFTNEFQKVIEDSRNEHIKLKGGVYSAVKESQKAGHKLSGIFIGKKNIVAITVLADALETIFEESKR